MEVFESRKKLHEKVYRHKTVVASESKWAESGEIRFSPNNFLDTSKLFCKQIHI